MEILAVFMVILLGMLGLVIVQGMRPRIKDDPARLGLHDGPWLSGYDDGSQACTEEYMYPLINPATGLLMLSDGPYGFDIGGNPYGSDLSSSTCWDSDISACGSSDW